MATALSCSFAALLVGIALPLAGAATVAAPNFPALSGRVIDEAGIIADATEAEITAKLATLDEIPDDLVPL